MRDEQNGSSSTTGILVQDVTLPAVGTSLERANSVRRFIIGPSSIFEYSICAPSSSTFVHSTLNHWS